MIGRMYTIAIGAEAATAAKTLIEVASAADSVTLLERYYITQSSFDTSENLGSKVQNVSITGTGSAATPAPMQAGDAAFGGTAKTNFTIEPTYSGSVHLELGFNVLSGLLWTPGNDDEIVVISPSSLIGINLDVAPSGSMDLSYGCTLREIGG